MSSLSSELGNEAGQNVVALRVDRRALNTALSPPCQPTKGRASNWGIGFGYPMLCGFCR